MNKRQIGQYNMLTTVEAHFNIHTEIWSDNPLIAETKAAFSEILEQISAQSVLQRNTSKGATMDKALLRKDLEEKGFLLGCVLGAYLSINPKQNQAAMRLSLTRSAIHKFRENDLLAYTEELNTAILEIIGVLLPYGITAGTVAEMMAARTAFHDMMSVPEEITSNRKGATETIPVLIAKATALLKKTMDNLLFLQRGEQPDFVNVYYMDRRIHRLGTRTLALMITTLDHELYTPVAEARIVVVDQGIKRISTKKGRNKVQNLKAGYYRLSVTRTGYEPQLISFSIVSGQTTHVIVELEKDTKAQSFKDSKLL